MERDFPDGFLWSTSTAAHQVEGGNVNDYLDSHLAAVRAAMLEGVDVRGYTYWSAFDNFELGGRLPSVVRIGRH